MSSFAQAAVGRPWLPCDQKRDVKASLGKAVLDSQSWEPVSIEWFRAWKVYVNFDAEGEDQRGQEEVLASHPGELNNSCLKGDFGDELDRNIQDGMDFVLLEESVVTKLYTTYNKDFGKKGVETMRFTRATRNVGTFYQPVWQIRLYPIRYETCIYDKTTMKGGEVKNSYYKKVVTLKDLKAAFEKDSRFTLKGNSNVEMRFWIKMKNTSSHTSGTSNDAMEEEISASVSKVESNSSFSSSSSGGGAGGGEPMHQSELKVSSVARPSISANYTYNYITIEKTTTVDGWKLFDKDLEIPCEILLTERNCLEVMVELAPRTHNYGYNGSLKPEDWPRHAALTSWLNHLKRGDVVDCMRKSQTWTECVVKNVSYNDDSDGDGEAGVKSIDVHFWTFDESCDETIVAASLKSRIAPLYRFSKKWKSNLEEDDYVDVKVDGVWVQGIIEEVDSSRNSVKVCYNKAMVDYITQKKVASSATAAAIESSDTKVNPTQCASAESKDSKPFSSSLSSLSSAVASTSQAKVGTYYKRDDNTAISQGTRSQGYSDAAKGGGAGGGSYATAIIRDPDVPIEPLFATFSLSEEAIASIHTHTSPSHASNKYIMSKNDMKSTSYGLEDVSRKGTPPSSGAVGLQNIRNTCYMNSTLQCLSHTPIKNIFLSGAYRSQLNRTNPTGWGGRIAKQYAQLMKDIYSGNFSVVVPRAFKNVIGQCWPQFSGWDQQDSQELMGYLIDGLHEDLNRVVSKPYVPTIQSYSGVEAGRPGSWSDEWLARDTWRRHLLRHNSIITEMLTFLTKSKVTCRNCKRESTTFEPYPFLPVPLPSSKAAAPLRVVVKLLPSDSKAFEVDVKFSIGKGNASSLMEAVVDRLLELKLINNDPIDSMEGSGGGADEWTVVGSGGGSTASSKSSSAQSSATFTPKKRKTCAISNHFWHLYKQTNKNRSHSASLLRFDDECRNYAEIYDRFYLVEIEKDAPPIEAKISYSAYSDKLEAPSQSTIKYCTLYAGKRETGYSSFASTQCEPIDLPISICYERGATTNADVYRMALKFAQRFIPQESKYRCDPDTVTIERSLFQGCFELVVTNGNGVQFNKQVPLDDSKFKLETYDCLMVLFSRDFKERIELDKKVRLVTQDKSDGMGLSSSGNFTLGMCLQKFLVQERLPEAETFYCSGCKEHLSPLKKLDLWSLPEVLIIQLKRFQYTTSQYSNNIIREKLVDLVEYPVTGLDLGPFMAAGSPRLSEAPPIYDLTGVSLHSGSLNGGHYTAYAKDDNSDNWYYYNDSQVSKVKSLADLVSNQAYVLFYKRRSGACKWGGMTPTEGSDIIVTPDDQELLDKAKAAAKAAAAKSTIKPEIRP